MFLINLSGRSVSVGWSTMSEVMMMRSHIQVYQGVSCCIMTRPLEKSYSVVCATEMSGAYNIRSQSIVCTTEIKMQQINHVK